MAHKVLAKRRFGLTHANDSFLVAGRNGASALHLAKSCFNLAYPVCERRFTLLCADCGPNDSLDVFGGKDLTIKKQPKQFYERTVIELILLKCDMKINDVRARSSIQCIDFEF